MKKNKQIPHYDQTKVIEVFLKETNEYLPSGINYEPLISGKEQEKILDRFKSNATRSKFCFVINGLTGKLMHSIGVEKSLGYKDVQFSAPLFFGITHKAHAIPHWMNGGAIWKMLEQNKSLCTFDDIQFVYTIALKHADGTYKYCSCESFFFQITKCGRGTEFGYEFTVLKDFNSEDFAASINDKNGPRQDAMMILNELKKEKFFSSDLFTTQEKEVLVKYAYKKFNTAADVARDLEIVKSTIITHNKNILKKAKSYFHKDFKDCHAFAQYLKNHSLI